VSAAEQLRENGIETPHITRLVAKQFTGQGSTFYAETPYARRAT
jgi:hypothetical protein